MSLPTVSVLAPTELVEIEPAPAIDPTVSVAFTLYVAPVNTVTAVVSPRLPVTVNVPALMFVVPV